MILVNGNYYEDLKDIDGDMDSIYKVDRKLILSDDTNGIFIILHCVKEEKKE